MPKYVFKDRRIHTLTRGTIILVIAPYMIWRGFEWKEPLLILVGTALLAFDLWSLGFSADTGGGRDGSGFDIHQLARAVALSIQVPIMGFYAYKHSDLFLGILAVLTFLADLITLLLGMR